MKSPHSTLDYPSTSARRTTHGKYSKAVFRYAPLLVAIFTAVSVLPVLGAQAAEPSANMRVAVRFDDLDLSRTGGQQEFRGRISQAARIACREATSDRLERHWCARAAARRASPQARTAIARAESLQLAAALTR